MAHESGQGDLLIAALGVAQREGNPVPGSDPRRWGRVIRVASKRWSTFERRHPAAAGTYSARVEDLARGLLERCAPPRGSGTPIEITDCRRLARSLAAIFAEPPAPANSGASAEGARR